jgi:arsenate reductase
MAEGFLKSLDNSLEVYSAGTVPAGRVHPGAIQVMSELGIDLKSNNPRNVKEFLNDSFDYVITVCDDAKETCPIFIGKVNNRLHIGFDDPARATGTEDEIIAVFRRVRDEIREAFYRFYHENIE